MAALVNFWALLVITGHSTMSSLEKFLRGIDNESPKDFILY